jgi:hypothetical protein
MATEEEVFKLIAKIEGEDRVKTLAAAASLAEQKFQALYSTLGKGAAATKNAAASLIDLQNQLKKAEVATGKTGQKLLDLGRIADDAQYIPTQGLRPIINNVMELSPKLGLVMIGLQLIYTFWDKLAAAFGSRATRTQAQEMEELAQKISKTADEMARLVQLQERQKNAQIQQQEKTEDQKKQADIVNKAIYEQENDPITGAKKGGYAAAQQAVMDAQGTAIKNAVDQKLIDEQNKANAGLLAAQNQKVNSSAASRWADEHGMGWLTGTGHKEADIKSAQDRKTAADQAVTDAINKKVSDILADAAGDPQKLQTLIAALEKKGGNEHLVNQLKQATPEALAGARRVTEELAGAKADATELREQIDLAKKSMSYLGKTEGEMTPAERAARREVDRERAEGERREAIPRAAAALGAGLAGRRAATGELTNRHVTEGLRNLGFTDEQIEKMAGPVGDLLKKQGDEAAMKRAGELGIPLAQARQVIRREQMKPIDDAFEQYGGSILDIQKRAAEAMKTPSRLIDSAGLANSIQQSVGGKDPQLRMVEEQQKANEILAKILAKPENRALILGR